MEKRQILQQVILGKLDSSMPINELRTLPHTIYKISSKWFKDLNIVHDNTKLLEENTGKTVLAVNLCSTSLMKREMQIKL